MRINVSLSSRRRHVRALLATGIVLVVSGGVYLSNLEYRLRLSSVERSIKVEPSTFETVAKARIALLQSRTSQEEILKSTGLKTGDYDWDTYVDELNGVYREFFETSPSEGEVRVRQLQDSGGNDGSNATSVVQHIRQKLAHAFDLSQYSRNASNRANFHPTFPRSIPHTVLTTSKHSNEESFPKQFSSWKDLNSADGWQIKAFNDDDIWRWIVRVFGGDEGMKKETSETTERPRVLEIFKQISGGVIRGDFFRYLVLLMEGGLYTDTDTACIRPLRQWPGIREDHWELKDLTDPMLSFLPHMFDLVSQSTPSDISRQNGTVGEESRPLSAVQSIKDRMDELKLDLWEPPALVVAVEFDYWGPRAKDSWTHWEYSRGMQIVQSTFMAQPGHPVFLDVLGRIMRDIQKGRAVIEDEANPRKLSKFISQEKLFDILDFTGPGVFSDAVFRYLMARWGVQPGDLTQARGPVRVGDVLIYPLYSFTSRDGNYGKFQGEHKLVYHQARGSWKGWVSD